MVKRMNLDDQISEGISKMVKGNTAALLAMMNILEDNGQTDPSSDQGSFSIIFTLDDLQIWDEAIGTLWTDICKTNTTRLIALVKAVSLNLLDGEILRNECYNFNPDQTIIDVEDVYNQVCNVCPDFDTKNRNTTIVNLNEWKER